MRGKADSNYWANDSVFVQFDRSVDAGNRAVWRIGTTDAAEVNLEEWSGRGVANWGWQDNGWGAGVLGPVVYFATSGPQKIRIQTREDGFSIDQIVLYWPPYIPTRRSRLEEERRDDPRQDAIACGGVTGSIPEGRSRPANNRPAVGAGRLRALLDDVRPPHPVQLRAPARGRPSPTISVARCSSSSRCVSTIPTPRTACTPS